MIRNDQSRDVLEKMRGLEKITWCVHKSSAACEAMLLHNAQSKWLDTPAALKMGYNYHLWLMSDDKIYKLK